MFTMLKSLILTLVLFVICGLPLIPALAFHFFVMYLMGEDWTPYSNIITIGILIVGCYYITKPGTFTYKVLRYIEEF